MKVGESFLSPSSSRIKWIIGKQLWRRLAVKRHCWRKLAILILVMGTGTPLYAQYWFEQPQPRWRLYGDAGFDFNKADLGTHGNAGSGSSNSQQMGGLVDANLQGFLFNPLFLSFDAGINSLQSGGGSNGSSLLANGSTAVGNRNGALGYNLNGVLLSGRGMPLTFHFVKTDAGLTAGNFKNNQTTKEWGAEWQGHFAHLRNVFASYRDNNATVEIPTSFYDTDNAAKIFQVNANDTLLGWDWSAAFSKISQQFNAIGQGILPDRTKDRSTTNSFEIRRGFWDDLVTFSGGETSIHEKARGSFGTSQFNFFGYHGGVRYRPSDRVSTGVTYTHDDFESGTSETIQTGTGQVLTLALPQTMSSSLSSSTLYRPWNFLNLTGGVNYTRSSTPTASEIMAKLINPYLGVSFTHRLLSTDLNGHANYGYQFTTSNRGREANAPSVNLGLNAARGSLQVVHYTVGAQYSHQVIPQLIGSHSNSTQVSLSAETDRFSNWRLTGGIDYNRLYLLTMGGQFNTDGIGFNLGANREWYGIRFYRLYTSGVNAIFPGLVPGNYITVLPIDNLVGSPLLNKTTRVMGFSGYYNWRRWQFIGSLNREKDLFAQINQQFNYIDIEARYQLGKFILSASYDRNVLNTGSGPTFGGSTFNRFRLRLTRSFTIF
jgi:hypothetical protein